MPVAAPPSPLSLQPATLLRLMWLASPALPVGGFSYSEGLEAAIEMAGVHHEASAARWLCAQLQLSQARGDMAAIAQAAQAWAAHDGERLQALNTWVLCTRESSEMRLQTEQMGRSLSDWLRNQYAAQETAAPMLGTLAALSHKSPTYPVAFALATHLAQASAEEALLAYAFGWAENMVQAALKAVPLGQSAGQRILAQLAEGIPPAVQQALRLPDEERQTFTPMLAILSARHETQYSRLFRS